MNRRSDFFCVLAIIAFLLFPETVFSATITGFIKDTAGESIANIQVNAYDNGTWNYKGHAFTLSDGSYSVSGLNFILDLGGKITCLVKGQDGQFLEWFSVTCNHFTTDTAEISAILGRVESMCFGGFRRVPIKC